MSLRQGGYENCAQNGDFSRKRPSYRLVLLRHFFDCRESEMGSNMIVLEVDPLFPDFGRFVIVGFFVDPPAVGPVFPFAISQIIAVLGTCQKAGDQ